eukprot:1216093-Rhodomonas_salina.2
MLKLFIGSGSDVLPSLPSSLSPSFPPHLRPSLSPSESLPSPPPVPPQLYPFPALGTHRNVHVLSSNSLVLSLVLPICTAGTPHLYWLVLKRRTRRPRPSSSRSATCACAASALPLPSSAWSPRSVPPSIIAGRC